MTQSFNASRFSKVFFCTALLLSMHLGIACSQAWAQDRKPAVEMTSILGAGLDQSGGFTMTNFDLIFGPPGSANAEVVLKTGKGEVIKSFAILPEYRASKEVYSRMMVSGALYVKLDIGDYLLDFMVEDELATRFPFKVVSADDGADEFSASGKKQFTGPWQSLAYLHYTSAHNFKEDTDYKAVNVRMWGSKNDLSAGSNGEQLQARLMRNGELIGLSKESAGFLSNNKPVNRLDLAIFKPHDRQEEANVLGLSEADLLVGDHSYRLTIERQKDKQLVRDFSFESKNGKLVPLPRTELSHTPHHEYLAPRAAIIGSQNYEFEPVYWLEKK